jgi:DNA repair protein RecN (Recombination protein N)
LTERRRVAAEALKEKIEEALAFLDMPKVRFSVRILALSEFGSGGLDDVEFLLSANPGEPLAPLAKIASGGELSRIMLAFRSVFVEEDEISSMIFDEIDTGISGKTSQKVGIKLKQIAAGAQVICITHSPQIAALADAHFRIAKEEIDGRNETSLRLLNDEERVLEVARILGGIHVTDIQKQTARELIEDGKAF